MTLDTEYKIFVLEWLTICGKQLIFRQTKFFHREIHLSLTNERFSVPSALKIELLLISIHGENR